MIATSVAYGVTLVAHIVVAVATLVVLVTMRTSALQVARGANAEVQAARFPPGPKWAARIMHLLPLTGLVLSLSGDKSVALSRPWVGVGLLCYLAAAGHLEARTLPEERAVATVIAREGVAPARLGRHLTSSVDVLLALVGVALVAMLVQF